MDTSFLTMLKAGGYSMVVIGLCSVAAVAVAIERLVALWGFLGRARATADAVTIELARGDLEGARERCRTSSSAAAEVFLAGLSASPRGAAGAAPAVDLARAASATERARQEATLELRRRLWVLGTVGAIAPFVGLFGTVVGIMNAFHQMAVTGQGGFAVVAAGISEALVATAGGIAVAVAAVVLYNAFATHVQRLSTQLRILAEGVLEALREAPVTFRAEPARDAPRESPAATGAARPAPARE
ncbi:MAG TPA: MotA/TolQ/ExbB proton channel family protein [Anaeromyxobacteraceae bacterium]|nr:MotA/TolQ/ExbB proton channel family protein [Anaeromyxobacteraceae bacterium]